MKFYSNIESMRANTSPYSDPFILQWEIPQPRDGVERRYIVFDGVSEYLKFLSQNRYSTCHEVFLSSTFQINDEIFAHPCFDFDMKIDITSNISVNPLPSNWVQMLQNDIQDILCQLYPSKKEKICEILTSLPSNWIWMTSPNSKKISKHLTIRKIAFSTWRSQMKLLVSELKKLDRPYMQGIDDAIYRKLGSLRLPLNSKRHEFGPPDANGISQVIKYSHPLQFDDINHTFVDGLVLVHNENMHTLEDGLILTMADLDEKYKSSEYYIAPQISGIDYDQISDEICNDDELYSAFQIYNKAYKTGLKLGSIKGNYLTLIREFPGKCPISGKIHDHENAYVYQSDGKIYFGCHRGCTLTIQGEKKKTLDITPGKKSSAEQNGYDIFLSQKKKGIC